MLTLVESLAAPNANMTPISNRLIASGAALVLSAGCLTHHQPVRTPGAEPGSIQYQSYCAGCHEFDEAPPLANSPWVSGPEDRLIRIALHGVRGPIEVNGKTDDREMPGFGHILSDADVASVLSFVRKRFGAPSEPIRPLAVSRVRAANQNRTDYWSVEELLRQP